MKSLITKCRSEILQQKKFFAFFIDLQRKRRKQNHKISFQFFAAPPCTPRRFKRKGKEILWFWFATGRSARCGLSALPRNPSVRGGIKPTTRAARAKLIKILRILFVKSSNFVQETPPIFTFARNGRMWSYAARHRMPRTRYAPRFFQINGERALGDVEVRLSKAQSKTKVLQPIFLFALSSDVKRFLISIVQKLTFQYKYEQ